MSVGQHRMRSPSLAVINQSVEYFGQRRYNNLAERILEHERIGQVIDVFASAAEMYVLLVLAHLSLEVVLH